MLPVCLPTKPTVGLQSCSTQCTAVVPRCPNDTPPAPNKYVQLSQQYPGNGILSKEAVAEPLPCCHLPLHCLRLWLLAAEGHQAQKSMQPARSQRMRCLQEPPEEQPTAAEFKSLIQSYCMALGPDTVTLPKGLPFRKERLDVIKDINSQLNFVLKNTKL